MANRKTLLNLRKMKQAGEKIACLTAYDASFARLLDQAGIDLILVGDSLGMVIQGHDNTLPVSMTDMLYHTRIVAQGSQHAMIVSDMPFMSYATPAQALGNAARLLGEAGAQMVKLEGGAELLPHIELLNQHGIPVMSHLGVQPQSIHQLGDYNIQANTPESAKKLKENAQSLEQAGVCCLLLECVPADLAEELSQTLSIPVIGIGAGQQCDGQILVLYDILGLSPVAPEFAVDFLKQKGNISAAIKAYIKTVKTGCID